MGLDLKDNQIVVAELNKEKKDSHFPNCKIVAVIPIEVYHLLLVCLGIPFLNSGLMEDVVSVLTLNVVDVEGKLVSRFLVSTHLAIMAQFFSLSLSINSLLKF